MTDLDMEHLGEAMEERRLYSMGAVQTPIFIDGLKEGGLTHIMMPVRICSFQNLCDHSSSNPVLILVTIWSL